MNPFGYPQLYDDLDEMTRAELTILIQNKLDEHERIRGQVASDLDRLGEMAFLDPKAYDKLQATYRARRMPGYKKKMAILEHMRQQYIKGGN